MSKRYSRIASSARLRPALDKYIQHLSGTATRTSRINTRGAIGEKQEVAIIPFTFTVNTGEKVIVTTNKDDLQSQSGVINASSRAQIDTAVSAVNLPAADSRVQSGSRRVVYQCLACCECRDIRRYRAAIP